MYYPGKGAKFAGERIVFSTNDARAVGYLRTTPPNFDPDIIHLVYRNSQFITGLNAKP